DVERARLYRLRDAKLRRSTEYLVRQPEKADRGRKEDRLPPEEVIILPREKIDDPAFDFHVGVTHADGGVREIRALGRDDALLAELGEGAARLVAHEIDFEETADL